jgi:hypothetical protein
VAHGLGIETRSICISTLFVQQDSTPSNKMAATATQISKKRKFVADGVFQAELGEFL